ncbi:MAG: DUF4198 domain-containing protein [Cytophagales bacterium]|nr:MAG: DUF4198 domain-containing protein [Cytophagales bacterium]
MLKRKTAISIALLFVCISSGIAHEFWLITTKFMMEPNTQITIQLKVGEGFVGEIWKGKIKNITFYENNKKKNLTIQDTVLQQIILDCKEVGTQLLVLESDFKKITLEAEQFNAYLEEDGLNNVINHRKQNQEMTKSATELYQRCAKMLLQVGNVYTKQHAKKVGLPLEIILLQNPYDPNTKEVEAQLWFDNKILPNAMIKVWWHTKDDEIASPQNLQTNAEGKIKIPIRKEGVYMISAVNMIKNQDGQSDWRSYWASYVFGFR